MTGKDHRRRVADEFPGIGSGELGRNRHRRRSTGHDDGVLSGSSRKHQPSDEIGVT
jgi:hypothetical protein